MALICQAQHGNLKKSGGARGVLDVVAMHLSCDYAVCVGALGRGSIAVDWVAVKALRNINYCETIVRKPYCPIVYNLPRLW